MSVASIAGGSTNGDMTDRIMQQLATFPAGGHVGLLLVGTRML